MTVPIGNRVYCHGATPCSGIGVKWSSDELDTAMAQRVPDVLFDEKGRANIEEILVGVAETDFAQEGLRRALAIPDHIEDWRVGEAIAESYLTDHRSCFFPWPDGRDERKSKSSLPGADLVGFATDDKGDCFAFGEVKTSRDRCYPPGTMYGRTGLKRQLEDLRNCESIRDDLMRYLGYRAKEASLLRRFKHAGRRYLCNKSDVQLYGFLVRDVDPNANDLKARVSQLATNCPKGTRIELVALYLPKGRIDGIGKSAIARRAGESHESV